ncbi:acriflavin resistance protein [Pseudomonas phage PH826]|nr:acriflavin resistance protein [Pseudomonas phage PH826]
MNTFAYAHYVARMDKASGSSLPYSTLFRIALRNAYRKPGVRQYDYTALAEDVKGRELAQKRTRAEKAVVMAAVMRGIRMGFTVSVKDGSDGEWVVRQSTDVKEISDSLQSTCDDVIRFRKGSGPENVVGSLWAIYGNSAGEVIADWSDNDTMAMVMAPAERKMEKYAELGI